MTKQESSSSVFQRQLQLPVLIAGAGPCGLVAAATFQKRGVPFVILERASRSKICSNAGSGFELAPTAVQILKEGLGVDINKIMSSYGGVSFMTIEGETIRKEGFTNSYDGGSVNRTEMQQYLLDMIFPSAEDEKDILLCGSGVESYRELVNTTNTTTNSNTTNTNSTVVAKLTSGREIEGCVLLACDGIHSRCRAIMHGGGGGGDGDVLKNKDPLQYCNATCYWGKTQAPNGSALQSEFLKTQLSPTKTSFLVGIATRKVPVNFFIIPSKQNTVLLWDITVASNTPTGDSKSRNGRGDLTRRGGRVLTEADKEKLLSFGSSSSNKSSTTRNSDSDSSILKGIKDFPLLERILEQTPAKDITQAGFFDRKNLNLPYTSIKKLVALLGDAAHPQTPYLGQGVNMAITDAYVYANILSDSLTSQKYTLTRAMELCDTDSRRKANKKAVKKARTICNLSNSSNPIICWVLRLVYKRISSEELLNQIGNTDGSNRDYWNYFQSLNSQTTPVGQ